MEQKHACSICMQYVFDVSKHITIVHGTGVSVAHATTSSGSTDTGWVTIKCEEHQEDSKTSLVVLRACTNCRIYRKHV